MVVSQSAYFALLFAVGLGRLVEIRLSARNQQRLAARGAVKVPESDFRWMVLLDAGVLVSAALEVLLLRRPLTPRAGSVDGNSVPCCECSALVGDRHLGRALERPVMDSTRLGIVARGPYRWIRHPNYLAVGVELVALALIHTAWLTAVWACAFSFWVLRRRLEVEERILLADPIYRATMAAKPRFFPRLFPDQPEAGDRARQSVPAHG